MGWAFLPQKNESDTLIILSSPGDAVNADVTISCESYTSTPYRESRWSFERELRMPERRDDGAPMIGDAERSSCRGRSRD